MSGRMNYSGNRVRTQGVPKIPPIEGLPSITRAETQLPKVPMLSTTTSGYSELLKYVETKNEVAAKNPTIPSYVEADKPTSKLYIIYR